MIAVAAALLTLGASLASTNGWSDTLVIGSLVAGAALIVAVPFVEARAPEPILPLELFRSSIYSISVAVSFLLGIAMFGTIIFMPLFLQRVVGVKATNSGVLLTPLMLGMVVASIVGGQVLSRTGRYKYQLMTGFGLMAVGMYLTTQLGVNATQLEVVRDMIVFGLGLGTSFPVLAVVGQNAVDHRFVGPATSSMQFIRQIGATLGLAVLGSVVAQDFNTNFAKDVSPGLLARIPAACRAALTNAQNLTGGGSGGTAACSLPAHSSTAALAGMQQLTDGLRLALTQSLHTAFTYGLIVALFAIVISLFIHEIPLRKTAAAHQRSRPEVVS